MSGIHETAIISSDAKLHESVTVGAYSIIEGDVSIGADTVVGPHCVIKGRTTIGERNRIYQFCSVGEDPQDKKYAGEDTSLVIGNDNTFREYCTLNRGTSQDKGQTIVGDNNWLMAYVHIAHDCEIGNETVFANNVTLAGHVTVGDFVIWGGFSGAHQFVRVGPYAFIANNAGVSRDVPPYIMASGQPAVPRGVNSEGLKRRNFDQQQVKNIKDAYRLLYRSEMRLEEATEQIQGRVGEQPELKIFGDFLSNVADRSIVR
ncbi:MAG: acyl-ACP--UDP-N-acetylglucosamine O-acyltransferase [bacterium]